MSAERTPGRRWSVAVAGVCLLLLAVAITQARQIASDSRDPTQSQDDSFARAYTEWTGDAKYGSPLVDHLPIVKGIPSPKDVIGYHVGAPRKLTYYADILKYYRALAAATPRVRVETIGKSEEGREIVVVWVSSEANLKTLAQNRANLAKIADPRGLSETQIKQLLTTTKPNYHVIGGLHSTETGPPEMLMELVYRLAVETSPIITQIRSNVYVSVTPVAEVDGRDRAVDWFYQGLELADQAAATETAAPTPPSAGARQAAPAGGRGAAARGRASAPASGQAAADAQGGRGGGNEAAPEAESGRGAQGGRGGGGGAVPYWGKYIFHDNNRDINLSTVQVRALTEWFFTAHPPIMHDLHESMPLMYTYSGGPPQNPNLDPLLFAELPWFSNWELAQMTKWGMPGVYTHAFMDGWSPGYYASVAYNHNALMKMYETQSGRDPIPAVATGAPASRGAAPAAAPTAPVAAATATAAPPATRGRASAQDPARAATQPPAPTPAARAAPAQTAGRGATPPAGGGGRATPFPTGRGGAQDREWYRGLPVPPNAAASFSRRANANYMQTGVLSSLQLTAMFPGTIIENFYIKTKNALEDGRTKAPYGFVIPVQREMTKAAELIRILRVQGIEIGTATSEFTIGDAKYPAGSWVIRRDQPYGRLAKNLLEKQLYPDTRLRTYDDSGWTMGLQFLVDVKEIDDPAILKVATTPVTDSSIKGRIAGSGSAGLAVAHYGSNNMIALRYRLKDAPMKIAEKSFTDGGVEFPAGSFVIAGAPTAAARAAIEELGLTATALTALPQVATHDAPAPRVAIYSQWTQTQDLGWYRLSFDKFGIPYDLIYKEQVKEGGLRDRYDVIVMAVQNLNRTTALQAPAARPQPYQKSEKYKFLGMYGETPDMSGSMGQEGVDAFAAFLEGGGTLIAAGATVRFPIEFGWAHTVDAEPISTDPISGVVAQRPIVQAEVSWPDHPVFYGYVDKTLPIKYTPGVTLRVGVADSGYILARYVGGDSSVLSGAMTGADVLRQRVIAADIPRAHNGKGRVILFTTNPVYRWQNHGEFNMVFNAILNWGYVPPPTPVKTPAAAGRGGRGGE